MHTILQILKCCMYHLSIINSTLNSCQKGSYLHINRPIIESIKINNEESCIIIPKCNHNQCVIYTTSKLYIFLNLSQRAHEIIIFGKPLIDHHYHLISLSDLCPGVEKKILKEIMYFHYMTSFHALAQEPLPLGS